MRVGVAKHGNLMHSNSGDKVIREYYCFIDTLQDNDSIGAMIITTSSAVPSSSC